MECRVLDSLGLASNIRDERRSRLGWHFERIVLPEVATCLPLILRGQAHEHTSFGWIAWQSHSSMADNRVVGLFRGVCCGGEVRVEVSRNAR